MQVRKEILGSKKIKNLWRQTEAQLFGNSLSGNLKVVVSASVSLPLMLAGCLFDARFPGDGRNLQIELLRMSRGKGVGMFAGRVMPFA